MNNNNFDILHFHVTRGNKGREGNFCTLTRLTDGRKGKNYRVGFSSDVSEIINKKGVTHFQLHVEKYTSSVFFVFLKGDDNVDARFAREKSGQVRINNRDLVSYLSKKLELTGDYSGVTLELSPDLANDDNFATFRINFNSYSK
jgi:AAA15 family ATPase/GTPase